MSIIKKLDQEKIKAKIKEVEKTTSGEIVPYFVKSCDEYTMAYWKAFAVTTFGGTLVNLLLILSDPFLHPIWMLISILVYGLLGLIAVKVSPLIKRLVLGQNYLAKRVERRAMTAFLSEEVFNTRERTGILIFISEFEHMVEVVGDTGINQKVQQEDWAEVIDVIIEGIKNKNVTEGIINGIDLCGELLEKAKIKSENPDNPNELDDSLRMG